MKQVDLFAGLGGFSVGGALAGCELVAAANHWPLAVDVHAANHPDAAHYCQDLRQFDFSQFPDFDLLTAGPACQGHSRAGQVARSKHKSVAKTHDALRMTAWAVIDCLEVCRPKFVIVENVPLFKRWELLDRWLGCMQDLGYATSLQVLTASRWGVPQRRKRLFIVGHRDGSTIQIADPKREEPGLHEVFDPAARGWISISDMRSTQSRNGHKTAREKAEISNARAGGALAWGQHTNFGAWGRSLDLPAPTITTVPGFLWWTRDGEYRTWTRGELAAAMTFPAGYDYLNANKSDSAKLIGNAVPVKLAKGVIEATLAAA